MNQLLKIKVILLIAMAIAIIISYSTFQYKINFNPSSLILTWLCFVYTGICIGESYGDKRKVIRRKFE